jgi:hypothetical protein
MSNTSSSFLHTPQLCNHLLSSHTLLRICLFYELYQHARSEPKLEPQCAGREDELLSHDLHPRMSPKTNNIAEVTLRTNREHICSCRCDFIFNLITPQRKLEDEIISLPP